MASIDAMGVFDMRTQTQGEGGPCRFYPDALLEPPDEPPDESFCFLFDFY